MSLKSLGTVFAVGARTAIGLDATQTALLLRTGIPAITAAPLASPTGDRVTMAFDATQDPFSVGENRAARLGLEALRDVARPFGSAVRSLKLKAALAFPEARPGQDKRTAGQTLASAMRAALRETFGDPPVDLSSQGSAGLAFVLPAALRSLATRECEAVLVGGVHSDYDPEAIRTLDAAGRLFSPERIDAVVPGEAAAFAIVARDDFGGSYGLTPLAKIFAVSTTESDITPYNDTSAFDARALAEVISDATAVLPDELRVGWAFGDQGFEHFRVRELYSALSRTHQRWCEPIAIDAPAQRIGNTGAASLALGLVLASDMFRRGYAPTPFGLLLAGSDNGERAAILVGSP
ncbi:MAG: beta-ketoacyl synthase N-terminal-like domain-containing protein [Polyangiaceae bacterium]